MILLADTAAVAPVASMPVWLATSIIGVLAALLTLAVNLAQSARVKAADEKQKLRDEANATHLAHDDERFNAHDGQITELRSLVASNDKAHRDRYHDDIAPRMQRIELDVAVLKRDRDVKESA